MPRLGWGREWCVVVVVVVVVEHVFLLAVAAGGVDADVLVDFCEALG